MLFFCALLPAAHAETASYYGTASGERFDPNAMTAAHRTLRIESIWIRCAYIRCGEDPRRRQ
jgi:rare lipoprotein A (peptidoglycan hydrolase)